MKASWLFCLPYLVIHGQICPQFTFLSLFGTLDWDQTNSAARHPMMELRFWPLTTCCHCSSDFSDEFIIFSCQASLDVRLASLRAEETGPYFTLLKLRCGGAPFQFDSNQTWSFWLVCRCLRTYRRNASKTHGNSFRCATRSSRREAPHRMRETAPSLGNPGDSLVSSRWPC